MPGYREFLRTYSPSIIRSLMSGGADPLVGYTSAPFLKPLLDNLGITGGKNEPTPRKATVALRDIAENDPGKYIKAYVDQIDVISKTFEDMPMNGFSEGGYNLRNVIVDNLMPTTGHALATHTLVPNQNEGIAQDPMTMKRLLEAFPGNAYPLPQDGTQPNLDAIRQLNEDLAQSIRSGDTLKGTSYRLGNSSQINISAHEIGNISGQDVQYIVAETQYQHILDGIAIWQVTQQEGSGAAILSSIHLGESFVIFADTFNEALAPGLFNTIFVMGSEYISFLKKEGPTSYTESQLDQGLCDSQINQDFFNHMYDNVDWRIMRDASFFRSGDLIGANILSEINKSVNSDYYKDQASTVNSYTAIDQASYEKILNEADVGPTVNLDPEDIDLAPGVVAKPIPVDDDDDDDQPSLGSSDAPSLDGGDTGLDTGNEPSLNDDSGMDSDAPTLDPPVQNDGDNDVLNPTIDEPSTGGGMGEDPFGEGL